LSILVSCIVSIVSIYLNFANDNFLYFTFD